jgi:hypothetical protein
MAEEATGLDFPHSGQVLANHVKPPSRLGRPSELVEHHLGPLVQAKWWRAASVKNGWGTTRPEEGPLFRRRVDSHRGPW